MINPYSQLPKISCLLVTAKNRFAYAKRSIQCYLDQTYSNKELLIINEGPPEYQQQLQEHVDSLNRSDIRCVWLKGKYTLGGLRNISMGLATGDYCCQWDDDDYCMPYRLGTQMAFLLKYPKAKVCYLTDQLQFFFHSSELYWNDWKEYGSGGWFQHALIPGTLLARQDVDVRYPHSKAGEDSVFANTLYDKDKNSIALMEDCGQMHVYTYHGINVYDVGHHTIIFKYRGHKREHMLQNRELICQSLDYWQLAPEVKVMGRDGLAFICRSENVLKS